MNYSEHTHKLMCDAVNLISRYLKGEISEEYIQNSIEAIGNALDNSVSADIREAFTYFPERVEEIISMEFPKNWRKLIEDESIKLREVIGVGEGGGPRKKGSAAE